MLGLSQHWFVASAFFAFFSCERLLRSASMILTTFRSILRGGFLSAISQPPKSPKCSGGDQLPFPIASKYVKLRQTSLTAASTKKTQSLTKKSEVFGFGPTTSFGI